MASVFIFVQLLASVVTGAHIQQRAACNSDNLLRALQHRTPDSYSFCSSYISQSPITTVTIVETQTYTHTYESAYTQHPQDLWNLQRLESVSNPTPITYTNKAVPTPVPGGMYYPLQGPPWRREAEPNTAELMARATTTAAVTTTSSSVPAYLTSYPPSRISSGCSCLSAPYSQTETTTSTSYVNVEASPCTYIVSSSETAVPSMCNVIGQVNSPAVQTGVANVTTVKKFTTSNKLDCCVACVNVFNCLWWKFDFAYPAADGTGDGWASGKCQFAFHTGIKNITSYAETPASCPNGILGLLTTSGTGCNYGNSGCHDTWNKPGYNKGPCGGVDGAFQSSYDYDYPYWIPDEDRCQN